VHLAEINCHQPVCGLWSAYDYSGFISWNGYVVSALTLLLPALLNGLIVMSLGKHNSLSMQNYFWIAAPLMSTAESIITGMVISGIALT